MLIYDSIKELEKYKEIIKTQISTSQEMIFYNFIGEFHQYKTGNILIILSTSVQSIPNQQLDPKSIKNYFDLKIHNDLPLSPTDFEFPLILNYIFANKNNFLISKEKGLQEIERKIHALKGFHWIIENNVYKYGDDPLQPHITINSIIQSSTIAIVFQINNLEQIYSWDTLLKDEKVEFENTINKFNEISQKYSELQEKYENLEKIVNESKAKIYDFREQAEQAINERNEAIKIKENLEKKNISIEQQLSQIDEEKQRIKNIQQNRIDLIEKELQSMKDNAEKIQHDKDEKIQQLNELIESLKNQIRVLEKQIDTFQREIGELTREKEKNLELIRNSQTIINDLNSTLQVAQEKVTQLENEKISINQINTEKKHHLSEEIQKIRDICEEIEKI